MAPLLYPLGAIGRRTLDASGTLGRMTLFLGSAVRRVVARPFRAMELLEQVRFIGNRSTSIVLLTSAFTGMVLALQGYNALARFGSEGVVGSLVALSLTRELAPVLTALMVTARAGSAITATLGNMRIGEQIDALRSLAVDPIQYLVSPKLVATVAALPMLTALFSLAGIGSAYVFSMAVLRLDGGQFVSSVHDSVEWSDVSGGLLKSIVFGVLIAWVATYFGFFTEGGAKGVGAATTRAVVTTAVVVLVGDYVMTALLFRG
ncbi:MAG TPA: ABC transporter permease [Byssovorax sp.]|jgi:phospholipid/cholesterol/gamma-HCH transport system permease protein